MFKIKSLFQIFCYFIITIMLANALIILMFSSQHNIDSYSQEFWGEDVPIANIKTWQQQKGLDLPLFFNSKAKYYNKFTKTYYFHSLGEIIKQGFLLHSNEAVTKEKLWDKWVYSFTLSLLSLFLYVALSWTLAAIMIVTYSKTLSYVILYSSIVMSSISSLVYFGLVQYLIGYKLNIFTRTVDMGSCFNFHTILIPSIAILFSSLGVGVRWWRQMFMLELAKPYAMALKTRGFNRYNILIKVSKNLSINLFDIIATMLPTILLGNAFAEYYFNVPGLAKMFFEMWQQHDLGALQTSICWQAGIYFIGVLITNTYVSEIFKTKKLLTSNI